MGKTVIKIGLLLSIVCFILFGLNETDVKVYAGEEVSTITEPTEEPDENVIDEATAQIISQITLDSTLNRAVGTKMQLTLNNNTLDPTIYTLHWISQYPSIVQVDEKTGMMEALSVGCSVVTCTLNFDNIFYSYSCLVNVTDPKFSDDTYYVRTQACIDLTVLGTNTTDYTLNFSDNMILTYAGYGGVALGVTPGIVVVTAEVDGRYISCTVVVSNPQVNGSFKFLKPGKKSTLRVTGQSNTTPVTFRSSNTRIVRVSATGVIYAVRKGSATITITVDEQIFYCYVGVSKSSLTKSLNSAYKALGKKYSQYYRMKKGYYDCSSLVWRCYAPYTYKFGNKRYAPTAAAQALKLVKSKKVIARKGISEAKLLPGDLLYMRNSTYNGRYKNIGHVAIYIGNGWILHAKDPKSGVCIDRYSTFRKWIVLVGRV